MSRSVLVTSALQIVVLAVATIAPAKAIDFKIDLPPATGKSSASNSQNNAVLENSSSRNNENNSPRRNTATREVAVPQQVSEEELNDSKADDYSDVTLDLPDTPAAPKKQRKAKQSADTAFSAPIDLSFPTPQCLKPNVKFWEQVYNDIDVNKALVHDRENMNRIYAAVKLSSGQRDASTQTRNFYRTKIIELSEMVDSPQNWDVTHRQIAKTFSSRELTRANLQRAAENIRVQTGLKSRFEAGVQRSLKLVPMIFDILQQDKLPPDIAYLPHVESSYHAGARSKVGAVGLWQIMPGTMKIVMGSRHVQNRTNPAIATQAAAKILKENYQTTGSWPLALTAYNHGLYGVMRAVRKTNSNDLCEIIDRYESRSFRFASSNFYAQFLAARNVAMQRYIQISKLSSHKNTLRPLLAASGVQKGKVQ